MSKKHDKREEEPKNYDWIVLGRHPSAVLSGCLASRLGAKVFFLPNVGQILQAPKARVSEDIGLDYDSGWIGGFSSQRFPAEQGLLDLCLNRIDPQLVQKWFFPEEQALLFTQTCRMLSESFLSNWVHRFDVGKFKNAQPSHYQQSYQSRAKAWAGNEKELVQILNRIPGLFHTDIPLKKKNTEEPGNRLKTFFQSKVALNFSSSVGRRLEKRWFLKKHTSLPCYKNRGLNREKQEFLTARFVESSGILLNVEELSQAGCYDWACFYPSRLRRIKSNVNSWVDDLIRVAQTQGARVDDATEIESILFHSHRYSGIEFVPGKQENKIRVSSHGLVCGVPTVLIEKNLRVKKRSALSKKTKFKNSLKGWCFSWVFFATSHSWEKSLPRRIVWSEAGSPPLEWEWDWVTQKGEEEKAVLRVRTVMPWSEQSLQVEYLNHVLKSITDQARRLFPGLELLSSKSRSSGLTNEEVLLKNFYSWKKLENIPENLRVYFGAGTGVDSGMEGLFLANETTYPALGSFGWPIAALESSAWLAHRLGMSGPLMDLSSNSIQISNPRQDQ